MTLAKIILVIVLLLALALTALVAFGRWRWDGLTQDLFERLEAARVEHEVTTFDARELDDLPPVVQRYFRTVLRDGAPIVTAVSVDHVGEFNMGETTDRWTPFTSRQRVVTQRPGFVWDGNMRLLPGLSVRVHDAYVAGEGLLRPTILGLFTLMELRGTAAVAEGELMRFFAEAAWYPTALLPSQGVQWTAVDDRSAQATMRDGPLTLTLHFVFAEDGLMASVRAEARGRTEGRQIVMRPWEGRWSDVQDQGGMRVPMRGEVAWLLPPEEGGRKPYWRGQITALQFSFAGEPPPPRRALGA